jgi:hypothetical protein
MAPTQLSLAGGSNLNRSNQLNGTPSGGTAASREESFTLIGSEMAKNMRKMKVSLPFTADDKVNPIPFMTMLLTTAKLLDPKSSLKLNDPMCSPIEIIDDMAKITNLDKYVTDLHTIVIKKQFVFFILLESNSSFHDIKFNTTMFAWLKDNKHWLMLHTMSMSYTTPLGFIMGMHPTMSSRDTMKALLDEPMQDIEFNLYAISQFYIDSKTKKKVNTNIVEIHVPSSDADRARELLSIAWQHTPFLEELATHSVGMPIEFIPNIKHGVMKIDTFCKTLRLQHEFAMKTLAISVEGIGGLEVEIDQRGTKITLANMITKLTDDDGKPLFFGVEPTKLTHTDGRYLLLTQRFNRQSGTEIRQSY